MLFFIYSRKSVYTGKGESIENQIEMCRAYILAKFEGVAEADIQVYEDEGFSAKNTDRRQFQRMLRDIRRQKPDYIVCYRLDRISRSVSDFSALIEYLNEQGISFICIKEEFDTSRPMGKAMMYIASVFAQLERETIAERVRDNMLMLARTGRWLGGTTPTGFTSERVQEILLDGKVKTCCKLKEHPVEMATVQTIFEAFLRLGSMAGVRKYLIRRNLRSRSGKFYSLPGIKQMLQNPVYCTADQDARAYFVAQQADVCFGSEACSERLGLLSYNKRDYKKKHAPRQPVERWIIAVGKHRGLVPGKQWVAVQDLLRSGKPGGESAAKAHNSYALLSGLIVCETCGSRMFAKTRSARAGLYDYICSNKLRGGARLCGSQNLNGPQADSRVCEALSSYAQSDDGLVKRLEKLKKAIAQRAGASPTAALDAQMNQCSDEMERLVNALSQSPPSATFMQRVNAKVAELEQTLARLAEEKTRLQQDGDAADYAARLDQLADALSYLLPWDDLSLPERRALVRLLVYNIVWDGKNLHVFIGGAQAPSRHGRPTGAAARETCP